NPVPPALDRVLLLWTNLSKMVSISNPVTAHSGAPGLSGVCGRGHVLTVDGAVGLHRPNADRLEYCRVSAPGYRQDLAMGSG
ncbi:MAG TPA: hypothetical protein VFI62_07865, partial [Burkholderiales bacterium]|nr:hypothetical protein [Burkholderiales bacterium]